MGCEIIKSGESETLTAWANGHQSSQESLSQFVSLNVIL